MPVFPVVTLLSLFEEVLFPLEELLSLFVSEFVVVVVEVVVDVGSGAVFVLAALAE